MWLGLTEEAIFSQTQSTQLTPSPNYLSSLSCSSTGSSLCLSMLYLFICINIFVFRVWSSVLAFRKARIMFVLPVLSFNRKQRAGTFRLCLFQCLCCMPSCFYFYFFTGLLVQLLGNHYLVCKNKGKIYWRVQPSGRVTVCMGIL